MKRDKLVTLQWSQSSDIMGGYNTPDSMLEIGRLMSFVYHEITVIKTVTNYCKDKETWSEANISCCFSLQ